MNSIKDPILFYDGLCNLCDKSVRFILKHEKKQSLFFAHLESENGRNLRENFKIAENFDGILFLEKDKLYGKSEAVLRLALYLKAPYSFLPFFFWIPLFIRDGIYDLIARKRYHWFGKNDCIVLDKKILDRFI